MKTNAVINNEGYIDRNKLPTNMRFLTLNIKGLDPKKIVKMERFINSIQKYQIDTMLLNEVNVKWAPANIDRIEQRLKVLGREISVITADSTIWSVTNDNYLLGGLLTIIRGKSTALLQDKSIVKRTLENWMAV